MTMPDNPWAKLAAMTGPDGKPLIPGLRKPCPKCEGKGICYNPRFGGEPKPEDAYPCSNCGGAGWVLVSGPVAIVAAQEFILSQPDPNDSAEFWNWEVEKGKTMDDGKIKEVVEVNIRDTWNEKTDTWHFLGISDPQPTYAAALAQALKRALEKRP